MMKFLTLSLLTILSVACIKTADQVHREKRFDSMSEQMKDSQGLVTQVLNQMKDMQSQLDKMNGRLEELEHKNSQIDPENISKMNESLTLMKTQDEAEATQLAQIQNELKEQRAFLEKVMAEFRKASQNTQKKSAKSELKHALQLVKDNAFQKARPELESLIDHKDLTAGERNKVLHGLGRVEFYTKNYEKGLVYFSKIFSKYPRSSLAPSSLLFIAKSLDKLGKKAEAKEAFTKVTEDYPESKEAKEAKKAL